MRAVMQGDGYREELPPRRSVPQHLHACAECGRPFYLCSERDCGVAPDICQGCELDRMDAYLERLTDEPK